MKNLLRKLHIGTNNDDQVDAGRIIEGRSFHDGSMGGASSHSGLPREPSSGAITSSASPGSPIPVSISPATSESRPSGLSTFLNAVKDSVGRVKDNEKLSNPISKLRQRLDSGGSSGGADDSSTGGKRMQSPPGSFKSGPSPPVSFKRGSLVGSEYQKNVPALKAPQTEEDYQVQMAMALSVSGNYQSATGAGVVEKAQIEAAKRISLGLSPAIGNSESDTASYRYWATNTVEYDEVIPDGFYDVFGVNSDERMPSLSDLKKMPISDTLKIEIVLVDRKLDPDLVALEVKAASLAAGHEAEDDSSLRTFLAQKIALIVAEHMGGPVGSETDMLLRWQKTTADFKSTMQTVVLTLGSLGIGLTRHRALLFKVLADHLGIPCQLVKGRHYPGVEEEGAVNVIKVDDNREFVIDLMGAPGALIPSDRTTTNLSETDMSPKSTKTEHSSSFVSSAQSSPSGSARSMRSDAGVHDKEQKDMVMQKGSGAATEDSVTNMKLDGRHHSEPAELQGLDIKPVLRHTASNRPSHFRHPSWTEGVGVPGGRQMKDISEDVKQLVKDAAKENPLLAQKLHDVLLETGIIPDISPRQLQAQVFEDKRLEDETKSAQEKKASLPSQPPRKKSTIGSGRPPTGSFKSSHAVPDEVLNAKDRLHRLNSVEGLGDRRPLELPPVDLQSPQAVSPVVISPALPSLALPIAIPVPSPVVASTPGYVETTAGYISVASTAAVVASTMVAAAARSEGGGSRMEVPIIAAATATAAVVAATSAAAGRRTDSNESLPVHSQPGSGGRETRVEEHETEGNSGRHSLSDERRSETGGGSTPGNSHQVVNSSVDGLDGEVSVDEERDSENMSGNVQKRYDAVLADVAEWEIPWEDVVIGDRIGIGSYGEVYRGDWHGSEVAVKKFLDQDLSGYALEEFISEVRIMRRLRHPNVVLFMGAITRAPHLSIVTEFLPRGSLYRLIHRPNSQLDERRRLRMALDVAKGMNYLHSGHPVIVHRDLKSPNLLVDKNWVVKVCDFGLSRMKHNTFLSSKSTAGTPEWMAPEMLRNEPSNEKCDVYSFGVILWELATLQQPWGGMNPMQVVGAVGFQYRRLEIPPEMDPGLASIIRECWHDNPNLRPSFTQLMAALRPLQRPLSAAQHAETSRQGQTSQGSTIQSQAQDQPPQGPKHHDFQSSIART